MEMWVIESGGTGVSFHQLHVVLHITGFVFYSENSAAQISDGLFRVLRCLMDPGIIRMELWCIWIMVVRAFLSL